MDRRELQDFTERQHCPASARYISTGLLCGCVWVLPDHVIRGHISNLPVQVVPNGCAGSGYVWSGPG